MKTSLSFVGLLGVVGSSACSHHDQAAAPLDKAHADAIANAPDRDPRDRQHDAQRKPAELLTFIGIAPGMHVADLGSGMGYTSELLARAVGPTGHVIAQDSPHWAGEWIDKAWGARLKQPVMANSEHVMRDWTDPLPAGAKDLDLVTIVAAYHDVIAEKDDPMKLDAAVFAALKHGGTFVVIDNSAKPGTAAADCATLHRVDEQLVREQVEKAGFKLAAESNFMRQAGDTRDWSADPSSNDPRVHTQDLFALKLVKP